MNKKIRFSLLTLLVMLCGTAFADYVKVTKTSDITDGDYLIVYETGNVAFNGALKTLDAESNTVAVTISDDKIVSSNAIDAAVFTIDGTKGTLKSASGLYIGITSNSNGLKQNADASAYKNSFAINDNGDAVISAVYEGSTMTLRYNKASNQERFRYYKNNGQEAIQLYKKVTTSSGSDNIVTNYAVDFNTSITTSDHAFQVASNWRHIVGSYEDSWTGNTSYPSYSYSETAGVDGSGALSCSTNQNSNSIYDLLVTPVVKGTVTIAAKTTASYYTPQLSFFKITDNGDGTFTRGEQITVDVSAINATDYTTITIPVAEAGERIGIRSSYVWLDNFSATDATIVPEPKITIASAVPTATTGTIKWEQQANGKVLVSYTVTVTNTGDVDLTQGTENFSVSIINGTTGEVYSTVAVPQDLAKGATSAEFVVSAEVDASIWPNSYTYINMNLKENLFGSIVQRAQSTYAAYEPVFVFRAAESTSTSSITTAQSWGTITESTTKNFEIANTGTAPLTIKSITLPEGFTSANMPVIPAEGLVIAKGTAQALNITQDATANGTFVGNLAIVYLDKTGAEQTYTLAFSATVIGENTWTADYNNTTSTAVYPAGAIKESGITTDWDNKTTDGKYNIYLKGYNSDSYKTNNNKFITPKLHAAAGEKLAFDVKAGYSSSNAYFVKVLVSTDRKNWNDTVAVYTYNATDNSEAASTWTTKTITFANEGDYYVAFALYGSSSAIDNIIGLEKVNVAHDLYIKEVSWPNAKEKSGTALSKPSVDIIPLTDETADAYTVKYVCGETVLAEGTPVALTASTNSSKTFSFSWTPTVESTTAYPGTKVVFEFTDGTKFESEPFDLTITNEAIFHFLDSKPSSKWYEPTDRTAPIAFGKLNGAATPKSFIIFNWGSADLTVNSISLPEGFTTETEFPFTVAAFNGENSGIDASSKALSINFTGTAAGTYSGNMVITYSGDKTFSLPISATKLDPTKWYANFGGESDQWPAGSVYQDNVSTTYVNSGDYAITSSSTTKNIFVTPKLTAAAGEKLMFDAKLYNSTWSEGKVVVYAAATREEVLNAEEGTTRDSLFAVSGQDETNPMTTDFQTFEVTVPAAGDYFFGFQISGRPYVDEIYGLKAAAVAHDWMVASSNVPAEAMQNVASTATVNILNLGLAEEAADSYTVTAYVDGKAAGTGTAIALPTKNKLSDAGTQISVNFKSPKAGTFPVYIEVKAGDYSVKTDPVDVVFAEEVAKSEADMATNGTTGDVPVYLNYKNSESITMYNADALAAAGLNAGSKIKKITYKGYKTSDEQTTSFQVYYKWTDDQTLAQPATDYPYAAADNGMTKLIDEDYTWAKVGSSSEMEDMIVLDFTANPLTYEAGKSLVIYMHSYVDGYKAAYFEKSTLSSDFCYTRKKDAATLSDAFGKITPAAIHFTLEATTTTISGTVKDAEGAAVEGATVTLISTDGDDIQYTGTTDAEGAYSINVIQNSRDYTAIATAPGHTTVTKTIIFGGESKTEDFVIVVPSTAMLTNPGFELSDAVTTNWAAGSSANSVNYESTGWKNTNSAAWSSSAIVAYGSTGQVNGASAPATDNEGNAGKALGISVGWSGLIAYQSAAITLPAGVYTLKVAAYNAHTATAFTSKLGFIPTEGSPYISSKTSFASKAWVTDEVTFTLNEDTEGKFQIGGAAGDSGSGNHAKVFFDNLTLTYKSFFAAAIEDLQAEIAKAEALKTEARTEGLTEFNAAIEDAKALLTSTDATAINAIVEALKAAETAFLTANLPVAEGTYYVFNPMTQKFLSRGNAYGTAAMVDDYGVAMNVTVTDLAKASYKLSSFDNGAAYGFDAWMYSDATGGNVRTYSITKVEGGITLTNTTNNQLVYVYLNDGADKFRVAGNAIKDDNYTDDAQTVWQLVTKEERDIIVARHEATQKTTAFTAAGIAEDAKLEVAEPTLVSFTSGNAWTQTVVRTENNQPATNANGTEMWQATGNYKQAIKKVPSGLYKVSIQAFYRNGSGDECAARYATGYNTVLAYLEANGNKVQVKSWAADKGDGNDPNSMAQAKAKFDEGKYLAEVYTFVGEDSTLNLTVNNPAHIGNGWFIAGNVKYAKVDEFILAGDATLDGTVTTADAVAAVNFALEKETPSEKAFKAADVNKSNSITVSDAVGIVNIALEITPEAPARSDMEAVNFLTMNGNALELMNTTEFVGFQMDVTLANGAMLNGVSLAERAAGLQVVYNRIADNTYRIIAFSAGNAAIEGNEGELFSLDITGNANVNITNIEFADAAARAYALGFGETTGIKGIYAGATNVESYTVGGIKNDKVRKGMNVVRTADGKVKKVYVK
ncbi:choice-of-anchor J domain-containing protein [Prevotella sp. E2-28]|uniref:choice-of-anchor J domain-containing protein n=1 Tax=Prevotella sp. E2-28 TaxID=2913620 RepID=UPI001EDA5AA7|nr:choice-of-anchor J domain-containing protein [Prevotella sp. E2-28]UKK54063.1 choice-of-anchor J domain-containing protein [Prevotella sp. E2-28]